jgi:peptide deformylase|tara:strand:- start:64 stop:591 length:528 start_codon:yes stop_codon:yes gene_type:complete
MLDIVLYPDSRLRAKNARIESFNSELETLAREMLDLMYQTKGVGLAAPQVGVNVKMMVFNSEGDHEKPDLERVYCNPKLIHKDKETIPGEEGCLSFPGIYAQVLRPVKIAVEAQDLTGETFQLDLVDWEARVFLHENDHLEGILFIDRLSPSDKTRLRPAVRAMEHEYKERIAGS